MDMGTPKEEWLSAHGFHTKEAAENWWRKRAKQK